jgi:hypothetical protein
VQRLVKRQAAGVEAAVAGPDPPAPAPQHSRLTKLLGKVFGKGS